jgi:AraC-like DNA-binding protein
VADAALQLYDPRNGDLSLKVGPLAPGHGGAEWQRSNYFTVYWAREGRGTFWADLARHPFRAPCLLFFNPYQAIRLLPEGPLSGWCVQFHANFLCIETYHHEIGCNGVLFNDVHSVPLVALDAPRERELDDLLGHVRAELREAGLAHAEALVSYLKLLLVKASRWKLEQQAVPAGAPARRPPALDRLRRLIEEHYRSKHRPRDYAALLHLAPKSLAKLVKAHLHKTLTELIRERVLKQAKWELLHTLKPVKQVAAELGFDDELYFSRLFKRATGCSPTFFRELETAVRGGSNLSPHFRQPPPGPLA